MQNLKLYDSYRGLLAIVVLLSHLYVAFVYPYAGTAGFLPDMFRFLSAWAVNIFFILSGYLITFSIFGNVSKNGYFKWSDFLVSRIARIYPPLMASIALSGILYGVVSYFGLHGSQSFRLPSDLYVIRESFLFSFSEIDDSLLMRGGLLLVNGALWSLYVEVKIYVVAMLVAILIKGSGSWLAKLTVLILLYLVSMELMDSLVFVAVWGLGAAFFMMRDKKIMRSGSIAPAVYALAFGLSLYYSLTMPRVFLQGDNTVNGFLATFALSLLVSGAIFVWGGGTNLLYFFSSAAKFSYTLYIVHFPLLLFAFSLTHQALSANFNYAKLIVVCLSVFAVILYLAYLLAACFEDKKRFESYIRKMLVFMVQIFYGVNQMFKGFIKRALAFMNLELIVLRSRPKYDGELDRYSYQSKYHQFEIAPDDSVLDVGSGAYPFPFATMLVDLYTENTNHRYEDLQTHGKPFKVADINHLPFEDKSYDFVYCSHVLEHVDDPIAACSELVRVGKRGYIETPTLGKDMLFGWAKGMHKWHLMSIADKLIFFEYSERELEGVRSSAWSDLIFSPFANPMQELFYLNQDLFNVMFSWDAGFECVVFYLDGRLEREKLG